MTDRRHAKAEAEVRRRDYAWFRANPDRVFRVRRSVPFEKAHWGADDHNEMPYMLVHWSPFGERLYHRRPLSGKRMPVNDEAFLALLWLEIEAARPPADGAELLNISPQRHLDLMRHAGVKEAGGWTLPR